MRLILARHGETENKNYNGITDVALSDNGCFQSEQIKKRLEREKIDKIYCSGLSRTQIDGLDFEIEPDLNEINFGLWEGLSFSEVNTRYKNKFAEWMDKKNSFRFPKGETLEDLGKRVSQVIDKIKNKHNGENVVLVCHGGPIRMILCRALNLNLSNFWKIKIDHASISVVEFGEDGQMVTLVNDTCHLNYG